MRQRLTNGYARSLWTFSVAFYGVDGVSPLLINWQDSDGIDVNVVLCLCWHAGRGITLEKPAISALVMACEPWRAHVIAPVRAARRAIKEVDALVAMPDAQALRERLLKLEIDLEHAAQHRLQQVSDAWVAPLGGPDRQSPEAGLMPMLAHYMARLASQPPLTEQQQLGDWLRTFVARA